MALPRRGEVGNVRFDPAVGAEIQKVKPAVEISIDSVGRLPLKVVVAHHGLEACLRELRLVRSPASDIRYWSGVKFPVPTLFRSSGSPKDDLSINSAT